MIMTIAIKHQPMRKKNPNRTNPMRIHTRITTPSDAVARCFIREQRARILTLLEYGYETHSRLVVGFTRGGPSDRWYFRLYLQRHLQHRCRRTAYALGIYRR